MAGDCINRSPIGSTALACDLYAFDLFAAPRDRYDFLDWVSRAFRDHDGGGGDASRTTAPLRAWYREMSQTFPSTCDPHALDDDDPAMQRIASYRFKQGIVQASFHWDASVPALYRARRAAQGHGVGLFEAWGNYAAVWMMSARGRFEVIHRADNERRRFG